MSQLDELGSGFEEPCHGRKPTYVCCWSIISGSPDQFAYHDWQSYSESMNILEKAVEYCDQKQETRDQEPLLLLVKKQQAITLYDGNEVESAKAMFDELLSLQRKEYGGSSVIVAEVIWALLSWASSFAVQ